MFGPIFVRRTDDFNGSHEMPSALGIENPNRIFIVIRQGGFDGKARPSRGPLYVNVGSGSTVTAANAVASASRVARVRRQA